MDQGGYASRCQPPNEEELSWYEYRTRPRSRAMGQYAVSKINKTSSCTNNLLFNTSK